MSFILDALKRAEQQRSAGTSASTRSPRPVLVEGSPRGPWPWIAAAAVAVSLAVTGAALWPTAPPPPVVGAAPDETPPTVAPRPPVGEPAQAPVARPAPKPPESTAAPLVTEPRPSAAERRAPVRPAAPATTAERDGGARVGAAPPADRAPASRPVEPPVVRSPRAEERAAAAPAPDPARSVLSRPASTPPPESPAPAGGDVKALASRISLQVLSWAPEPKDRFVFLNGRRYVEGQVVDDKLLVERITEDGVVLSFQGQRVTLKGR
jgi:general secretion pathway protein B